MEKKWKKKRKKEAFKARKKYFKKKERILYIMMKSKESFIRNVIADRVNKISST